MSAVIDECGELVKYFVSIVSTLEKLGYQEISREYNEKVFGNIYIVFEGAQAYVSFTRDRGFVSVDVISKSYPDAECNLLNVLRYLGREPPRDMETFAKMIEDDLPQVVSSISDREEYKQLLETNFPNTESLDIFFEK